MEPNGGRVGVRWRRVAAFNGLVWLVSYGMVGAFLAGGGSFDDASWVPLAQVSALVPALVAVALTRFAWREPVRASLGLVRPRGGWLVACLLAPWVMNLAALAFGLLVPGVAWDGSLQPAVDARLLSPEQLALLHRLASGAGLAPVLLLVPLGLLSSVTLSFVANSGEEIGWRGLVHGELRPLGFWRNATVTGLLWFAWHVPLVALGYGFPRHRLLGTLLLGVSCLVSSAGYALIRERTRSSLAVALFEGSTEGSLLLAVAPLAGGSALTVGMASLSWLAAQAVVVAGLFAVDRFLLSSRRIVT
jgi:hypothetical protein